MTYTDKYNQLSQAYGSGLGSSIGNSTKDMVNQYFVDSPYYEQIDVNGILTDVRVVKSDNSNEMTLLFKPDTKIDIGSLCVIGTDNWLVLDSIKDDIFPKSAINLCNDSIKWINTNSQTVEYFFVVYSPSTAYGVDNGKVVTVPDEVRNIIVAANVDTKLITKDKRFIFDNRAWKVTAINGLTKGLIYLSLKEDLIDTSKDNLQDRIADYYTSVYTLTVLNGDSISLTSGSTLQLQVEVKNNGNLVSSPSVTYSSSDINVATVDVNGLVTSVSNGNVTITASLSSDNTVNDTIAITVEAVATTNYTTTITSTSTTPNEIKNGQDKTYNANVYNNGVQITDGSQPVTWELYADDQTTATTLASITSQDASSCTVHNNNASSGYIQLKCILTSDPTIVSWIRIQMKALF